MCVPILPPALFSLTSAAQGVQQSVRLCPVSVRAGTHLHASTMQIKADLCADSTKLHMYVCLHVCPSFTSVRTHSSFKVYPRQPTVQTNAQIWY